MQPVVGLQGSHTSRRCSQLCFAHGAQQVPGCTLLPQPHWVLGHSTPAAGYKDKQKKNRRETVGLGKVCMLHLGKGGEEREAVQEAGYELLKRAGW